MNGILHRLAEGPSTPMSATRSTAVLASLALLGLSACASHGVESYRAANLRPYEVNGREYQPRVVRRYDEVGVASWYDYPKQTRRTASGEWFDARALSAAHKTLPLPCLVEVTDLENGRKIRVRVNDRGPFAKGRLIDLSPAAADRLGMSRQGTARVRVRQLGPAPVADSGEIRLAVVTPSAGAAETVARASDADGLSGTH
jgi:rare lipoprotein A